jgi:hypothetical protein
VRRSIALASIFRYPYEKQTSTEHKIFLFEEVGMKIKTKGKCEKCGELFTARAAASHLLKCFSKANLASPLTAEGYLVRISWSEQRDLYWMFVSIPKYTKLSSLDHFLRETWHECCGHLSKFTISNCDYISHPEAEYTPQSMDISLRRLVTTALKFTYEFDEAQPTELTLEIVESISFCAPRTIIELLGNESPLFPCEGCEGCEIPADTICSICKQTTCWNCSLLHSCAIEADDTYMLMELLNSPRTGICTYA